MYTEIENVDPSHVKIKHENMQNNNILSRHKEKLKHKSTLK